MGLKLERKVRKVGDSLTISIPADVVKFLKLKEGDLIELDVEGDKMTAQKKEEK